jgi:hypothetical protein
MSHADEVVCTEYLQHVRHIPDPVVGIARQRDWPRPSSTLTIQLSALLQALANLNF